MRFLPDKDVPWFRLEQVRQYHQSHHCFEEFLYLFIFISAVALDDGMYDAIVLDFGIVVEFEDDAVRKFFLIRTKRADKVTETLWEHRDGAIYKIYRCCTFHSFLVDDTALCDVM